MEPAARRPRQLSARCNIFLPSAIPSINRKKSAMGLVKSPDRSISASSLSSPPSPSRRELRRRLPADILLEPRELLRVRTTEVFAHSALHSLANESQSQSDRRAPVYGRCTVQLHLFFTLLLKNGHSGPSASASIWIQLRLLNVARRRRKC